jgi:hypothetical protein
MLTLRFLKDTVYTGMLISIVAFTLHSLTLVIFSEKLGVRW